MSIEFIKSASQSEFTTAMLSGERQLAGRDSAIESWYDHGSRGGRKRVLHFADGGHIAVALPRR